MPIAADTHNAAAVVKPFTISLILNIVSTPMNPIPTTILSLSATRYESTDGILIDIYVKIVEPIATRLFVLIPAGLFNRSLL